MISNQFDSESLLATIHWIVSPGKTSLKTSFQEFVPLQNATGIFHPAPGRAFEPSIGNKKDLTKCKVFFIGG
jgi:hypothetical protein